MPSTDTSSRRASAFYAERPGPPGSAQGTSSFIDLWKDVTGNVPFPAPTHGQAARIRALGEQLDAHRKRQQSLHPDLTITGVSNVLEKLRSGESLTAKEKVLHEQGLVSVLKQIHDDLDAAVFEAYGGPPTLTDEEILERLVALNAERADEDRRGLVRWLRPEFQNPSGSQAATRTDLGDGEEPFDVEVLAAASEGDGNGGELPASGRVGGNGFSSTEGKLDDLPEALQRLISGPALREAALESRTIGEDESVLTGVEQDREGSRHRECPSAAEQLFRHKVISLLDLPRRAGRWAQARHRP